MKKTETSGLASMPLPYFRDDLKLIRRAAEGGWETDDETKRLVVKNVIDTRDSPESSESVKRAAIRTLIVLEQKDWVS